MKLHSPKSMSVAIGPDVGVVRHEAGPLTPRSAASPPMQSGHVTQYGAARAALGRDAERATPTPACSTERMSAAARAATSAPPRAALRPAVGDRQLPTANGSISGAQRIASGVSVTAEK